MLNFILLFLLLISCISVCYTDFTKRKISNNHIKIITTITLIYSIVNNFILDTLLYLIIAFIIGIILVRFRVYGSGDIKLIMALTLGINPVILPIFYMLIGFIGGVQVLTELLYNVLVGKGHRFERGIPYGIAISISGFISVLFTHFI